MLPTGHTFPAVPASAHTQLLTRKNSNVKQQNPAFQLYLYLLRVLVLNFVAKQNQLNKKLPADQTM